MACAAQLDGRKPMPKDNVFVLSVEEFQELFNTDVKNAYREMEDAANKLYDRDMRKIDKQAKKRMRWVYMAEYRKGEGRVKLGFSPEITPYLTMLHKRFTSYRLAEVSELGSTYSVRLYEMLAQFQGTRYLTITVANFKERLQLEGKYERFANLKARVIEPAIKELNQKTSIEVKWVPIKKGRTVERLEFRFEEKAQMALL
ncbi:replication initiation protein [Candidatus Vondammii sp. HM_W22]|uniref:replication initiation protein n=1 Tax=Candidatus Vondammii sp. HM_W22 TaxID=2687299 RepID=UPI001F12A1DD|nr:replication initiation protein [Candidatus Vondammii sp. HM_W22]